MHSYQLENPFSSDLKLAFNLISTFFYCLRLELFPDRFGTFNRLVQELHFNLVLFELPV